MPHRLDTRDAGFERSFARLLALKRAAEEGVDRAVAKIVEDVRARGDEALIEYTERFDRLRLTPSTLRIPEAQLAAAEADCAPEILTALRLAADRIEAFHRHQRPQDLDYCDPQGVRLGYRWTAVDAAGLYVPGGTAAYPSSVLMNALPAKVAGVGRVVMTVPAPNGQLDPLVLAAARVAGIDEVYQVGGAQAVAALAYGTRSIPAVDKIVGPGNAYVAAAKRQVFGVVGIDTIAGPSEVLVVAEGDNDPEWIAADLLAQSEHDEAAQAILITEDAGFAAAVVREVELALHRLPRGATARASWEAHGAVIVVAEGDDLAHLIDRIAPEHLQLAVADPEALAARVRHAGAIFLGRHTPEAVGDYLAGPNHVLPTSRSARFASGLSVLDFMKRSSLIACTSQALAALGPHAVTLARAEGLDAHALSVSLRLRSPADESGRD